MCSREVLLKAAIEFTAQEDDMTQGDFLRSKGLSDDTAERSRFSVFCTALKPEWQAKVEKARCEGFDSTYPAGVESQYQKKIFSAAKQIYDIKNGIEIRIHERKREETKGKYKETKETKGNKRKTKEKERKLKETERERKEMKGNERTRKETRETNRNSRKTKRKYMKTKGKLKAKANFRAKRDNFFSD